MRVVVTVGTGSLGRRIVRRLLRDDHKEADLVVPETPWRLS